MANKREQAADLRAYAQWNPDNDPKMIADLDKLQREIDEGRATRYGKAVIAESPESFKKYSKEKYKKNAKLGRALIVRLIEVEGKVNLEDGSLINVYSIRGAVTVLRSIIDGPTINIRGSTAIVDSEIISTSAQNIRDSLIQESKLVDCGVDDSIVAQSSLVNTPIANGSTITNVDGSTGGRTMQGELSDMTLVAIGDQVFPFPKPGIEQ